MYLLYIRMRDISGSMFLNGHQAARTCMREVYHIFDGCGSVGAKAKTLNQVKIEHGGDAI